MTSQRRPVPSAHDTPAPAPAPAAPATAATAHPAPTATVPGRLAVLDLQDVRWPAFVAECAQALPFHHPVWARLLADCYRYRPRVLAWLDARGEIAAGLPALDVSHPLGGRRWVALPFTDYCPPLVRAGVGDGPLLALVEHVRAARPGGVEVRATLPPGALAQRVPAGVRHTLRLHDDPQAVYRGFSSMHRRNIRKAERDGVRVEQGSGARDLQTFYDLHLQTRRRLGVPIQPRRFFRLLAERVLVADLGVIFTAYLGRVPIASALFLTWNGVVIYKFGASDARHWQARPNNLLFWTAIRWACERGYRLLDWGRTDLEDTGLQSFKSGWGAVAEPLVYSVVADRPPRRGSGRLTRALRGVIQRSSPWVCQAIGELAYRYAV